MKIIDNGKTLNYSNGIEFLRLRYDSTKERTNILSFIEKKYNLNEITIEKKGGRYV
jgi:hypothetical protein